jgi:hypothetical protein
LGLGTWRGKDVCTDADQPQQKHSHSSHDSELLLSFINHSSGNRFAYAYAFSAVGCLSAAGNKSRTGQVFINLEGYQ